jgi:DeoR/GlpR family transcriptional regulator of sugar metabolism
MNLRDRETRILNFLRERREGTVAEICRELYVSEPTVRRALATLAELGMAIRTHGGAIYKGEPGENLPLSFREREHSDAKAAIAAKCLELIKDGDTIMADASSSALALLRALPASKKLTVITNSAKAALILGDTSAKTFVTGGELAQESYAFVGGYAESFVRSFHADLCFFSVRTLTPSGELTDNAVAENAVRRAMLENSEKSILMLDSQKIAAPCLNTLATLDGIDLAVSECDISANFPKYKEKFI